VRRAIGYVPQAVSVDGSLTGYENLLIFAKLYDLPHREQQARIAEALEFMNLTADAKRLVGEYSGGMVRRLEIAQSTLHRPKVLFLDEPTVGLDPIARDAVWKHLLICAPTTARRCFSPRIIWRRRRAIVTASPSCTWQGGCAGHLQRTRSLAGSGSHAE
jgi:ABC-type Na+ transport system ATPase subunit NatA